MIYTSAAQKPILLLLSMIIVVSILFIYNIQSIYNVRAFTPAVENGSTFTEKRLIQFDQYRNLTDNGRDSLYGQVTTSGDNVYVVWQESVPGESKRNYDIFFKRSNDSGDSFSKEINLSNNRGFSEHPQISSSEDSVYVVWADDSSDNRQIIFRKSNDKGDSFSKEIHLSNPESQVSESMETFAFGSSVYVVWLEKVLNGTHRVMLASSKDHGATFGEPQILSENAMDHTYPKVSAFGEHVYVSWNVDEAPTVDSGVFFIASSDNAETFSNVTKLNRDKKDFGEPQIASYANKVYVIWGGSLNNKVNSLFLVTSEDNGKTFTELKSIEETKLGKLVSPRNVEIVTDEMDQLFIVWQDHIQTSEKEEILFASSNNGGQSFNDVTNLSNNIDISECPSIATNGKMIFTTWEDLTPGNKEIFFMQSFI
jgi:hypothetical protein